jgi:peptidoglycan hydrolase-like protein with peptidoglycan-binding domain
MSINQKVFWTRMVFVFLMAGMLGLSLMPQAFAGNRGNIKKVQETLRDKGYDPGPIDGIMGSQTRAALSQYQKAQNLPVTGHVDAETAGKLGVEKESEGGDFKTAGKDVGRGGEGVGHEMKKGKPIAAGKDLGEGVGKGGKKVGEGVKKAVSPHSDSQDPEQQKH